MATGAAGSRGRESAESHVNLQAWVLSDDLTNPKYTWSFCEHTRYAIVLYSRRARFSATLYSALLILVRRRRVRAAEAHGFVGVFYKDVLYHVMVLF
jgi:hypothetical protein